MARAKRKLPAKPAGFVFSHHRSPSCCRHPIPEHKAPAADDNTHPTKTSRPGQTAPTDTRTQKKPAAAPNTAGRFCFFAPPQSLLLPSSDTRTQSPRRRRQYTPHKNLTARSNGTDRRPNTKKPAAAPNTAGRFLFSAAPPSLLPPSTGSRAQKTRCRSEHRRPVSFLRNTAVTSAAVIRYPNTKPPPPTTIHTPQKPHGPVKRHRPIPEHKKNPLPLRTPPAGFVFSHHRSPSCCRHPIPEHKAPPPTTIHTPQKPHGPIKRHQPTPEHKKPAAAPNTASRRTTPPHTT